MLKYWLGVLGVSMFLTTVSFGQIVELPNEAAFSPEQIKLDFSRYQGGTQGKDLFDRWGIGFEGTGPDTPTVRSKVLGVVEPIVFQFLSNENTQDRSMLIVDFRYPQRQIGFWLRAESPETATITAFDGLGNNLGSFQKSDVSDGLGDFAAFEVTGDPGITKVTIEYADAQNVVQLVGMLNTYVSRPLFETYLAQIADGTLPGGAALRTQIVIANLTNSTAAGELLLFGDDGEPLELELNGEKSATRPFSVPPFASRRFQTSADTTPPVQGYARLVSSVPTEATAIFQILNSQGAPVSEAGVGGASAHNLAVAAVSKLVASRFDSGIAVANVSDQTVQGFIQLIAPNGQTVGLNTSFLRLGPREHVAAFLPDLFPLLAGNDFAGTMLINGDQPLAVVTLRTASGLVLSSLPVGSTER